MDYVVLAGGVVFLIAGFAIWVALYVFMCGSKFGRFRLLNALLISLSLYGTICADLAQAAAYADRENRLVPAGAWRDHAWNQSFAVAAIAPWIPISGVGGIVAVLLCVPGTIILDREDRKKTPPPHNYQI